MNSPRFLSARLVLLISQAVTGVLTGFSSMYEWTAWWLCAIPWAVLNLPGLILALPVIAAVYVVAGVAHLDWKSRMFFVGWFIAAPTILSILACQVWMAWRHRRKTAAKQGPSAVR